MGAANVIPPVKFSPCGSRGPAADVYGTQRRSKVLHQACRFPAEVVREGYTAAILDGPCVRNDARVTGHASLVNKDKRMKTILMTGAAGRIGTLPAARARREVPAAALRPEADRGPAGRRDFHARRHLEARPTRCGSRKAWTPSCISAGSRASTTWEHILSANIVGFYNALEAARRNGVKRFLVATSNHAVGFYRCDQTIDHRVYPKPDSRYGVSKVFNEALASLYADRYGMEMFCMRIGNVNRAPIDQRRLAIWISAARHGAARHDRHRASRHPLRDRLRHLGQQARAGSTTATPAASATGRRIGASRTPRKS